MRDFHHFLFHAAHIEPDRLTLDADEAHHAATVLRLAKDDPFLATDGKGAVYTCTCESKTHNGLCGLITGRTAIPRVPRDLQMLVGLCERPQFETIIVNLTALGVREITPVISKYCQKPWWEHDWKKQAERFTAKMVAAMKQSLYPYLPDLSEPLSFALACANLRKPCLVADPEGASMSNVLNGLKPNDSQLSALVGPPGGFSVEELFAITEQGGVPARISETRLTTELAAVVMSGMILGTF